ncbi:MAG: hypothetical protein ACKV2U_19305 [Bryobacteraceae bacterium]
MSDKTEHIPNGLESPFLGNRLFAGESPVQASGYSTSILNETPFLQGFAEDFPGPALSDEQDYEDESFPDDAEAFAEEEDEEPEEEFSAFEYDTPTTASAGTPDSLLAVSGFAANKRALVGILLTPAENRAAIRWNGKNYLKQSGVTPDSLLGALGSYVDVSAIDAAIANYNSQNPKAPIDPGTKPVDAIFVEAIHQFQLKCYRDSKQRDGFAGPSVLDSLGFWPRKGLRSSAQTNTWAKNRVSSKKKNIEDAISASTALTGDVTADNWWTSFVNPSFLGWGFARPIHVYFARKLRKAEVWLQSQPRFAGTTPVEMAVLLDINEKHAGGRANADSKSIHTIGLGVDIKYTGNPHVGDYRDKPNGAKYFSEVMKRAAAKISNLTLTEDKFPQYLNKLGTDTSKTTRQIHDELVQRDRDLREYLALPEARTDLATLRKGVFTGSVSRNPLNGFLNLDKDLVVALRDHACLIWGAVDLGAGASGDIMHFDCRLDDIGRAVFCGTGGYFNDKHPCWKSADPPCPQAAAKPAKAKTSAREFPEPEYEDAEYEEPEEYEDDSIAELEEPSEERPDEFLADNDEEMTYEFQDAAELDEEELIETEAPPLLKNPSKSNPPGQTLTVEIKLGRDSRCVEWAPIEGTKRKKCVKYTSFVIRPMTGIFIPENYTPQASADLILYLHGHKTEVPGWDALIADYWDGKTYPSLALREEINASGKNVILVAPTLALKSEPGDLVRRGGLDNYLDKVLEALKTYGPYKNQSLDIGNLILTAHSGGGVYMRLLATSDNAAAGKVRECWGFDSLYNSGDVEPWRVWAKADPKSRFFYSYYFKGSPTANSKNLEKDSRGRADIVSNIFPVASQVKDHFRLVRHYLKERLQGTSFLKNVAATTPKSSKEVFGEMEDHEYFDDSEMEDNEREDCEE